jgi:hypothetical protein
MQLSPGPNFTIKYLGEFETDFENNFGGVNLGPRGNRVTKKMGRKTRDSVS